MRVLDYFFAWVTLLIAVSFMLAIEILHLRATLEIPFLWLLVAMVNFLRLRNGYARVPGLMVTCVGANLVALTMEVARCGLARGLIWKGWGPFTLIAAVALLAETVFSVARGNDPGSTKRA